jgi:chromate transport protein ChrA
VPVPAGPASSQTGFAIGLIRAGYAGALGAWAGFTPPSAILLVLFAYGAANAHSRQKFLNRVGDSSV